ncbi:hypothetical protein PoB_001387200 [Plakobranchus ocellatus]|uniref:Secreted protein n=1 Tax=Plakobranchus ocellatus TaxID=259542 RepID=A0AAV3YYT2_9GAST|nr:hypothetical protein PoB_001387200 [Plakobranchus ocellatus]
MWGSRCMSGPLLTWLCCNVLTFRGRITKVAEFRMLLISCLFGHILIRMMSDLRYDCADTLFENISRKGIKRKKTWLTNYDDRRRICVKMCWMHLRKRQDRK